jgi:chromosome segregation ATPase
VVPWRTPDTPADAVTPVSSPPVTPSAGLGALGTPPGGARADETLERGFVASLRWLVSEGDARGVRRIAVELRALREALATLDETRVARDDQARRAAELDREIQAALAVLGPGTAVQGNGSLVERLARLRQRIADDTESRRQLIAERDAFRAMCDLMTVTRARVHELLEESERNAERLTATVDQLRETIVSLETARDVADADAGNARGELTELRATLRRWTGTIERALGELGRAADPEPPSGPR